MIESVGVVGQGGQSLSVGREQKPPRLRELPLVFASWLTTHTASHILSPLPIPSFVVIQGWPVGSGVESRSSSVAEWALIRREVVGSAHLKSAYDTSSLALTLPIYSPFIVVEGWQSCLFIG